MRSVTIRSRRQLLKLAVSATTGGLVATLAPRWAQADALVRLTESDPTAAALGYREDASKVDAAKSPTHKAGQTCANCRFYAGADKSTAAACQLFPGKEVVAKGWCSAYNAKA